MGITIVTIAIAAGLILLGRYLSDHVCKYDDTISILCFIGGTIASIVAFIMICCLALHLLNAPYEVEAIKAKAETYQYLVDNPPTELTLDQNNLYREIVEFNENTMISQKKSQSFWFWGWYPRQWNEIPLIEFHK